MTRSNVLPKIKPERIAGIVALSYLVLIPAGAFVAYRKVQILQEEVDALWDNSGMKIEPREPIFNLAQLKNLFVKPQ